MKNTIQEKLILLALSVSLIVGAAGCTSRNVTGDTEPTPPVLEASAEPSDLPVSPPDPAPTTPVSTDAPKATEPPVEAPSYTGPELPLQESTDDGYFEDAAFFGNSLVHGLQLYGGISTADYYAVTSASVVNISMTKNYEKSDGSRVTLLDAIKDEPYNKIYILLGINEIGFDTAYFISLYSDMLDTLKDSHPGADIYIMSLTPVTQKKSEEGDTFSMERIGEYNQALYRLAGEKECYFVDLVEALQNEDGFLDGSQSTDGIHLKAEKYIQWADYLRCHYIPQI